jgi:LysR family positive regulator for ilvC
VPRRGLVREAAERWLRAHKRRPAITAEPDSHEALLTLVALGYGTGVVPRLVLDASASNARLSIVEEHLAPYPIGLCVRRADLRRDLVAHLWASTHSV